MTIPYLEIAFFSMLPLVIYYIISIRSLARLMKEKHNEAYLEHGMDGLFPGKLSDFDIRPHSGGISARFDNGRSVWQLLKFLFGNKYKQLNDRQLLKICTRIKILFIMCMFLLFIVFIGISKQSAPNKSESFAEIKSDTHRQAYALHRQDKWEEAIRLYNTILDNNPRDSDVMYWRAMAHWKLNKYQDASKDFHEVIKLDPDNFKAYKYADRLLSRERRWEEIIEMWGQYIKLVPDNAEAYMERGGAYHRSGNRDESIRDAKKACDLGLEKACKKMKQLQ